MWPSSVIRRPPAIGETPYGTVGSPRPLGPIRTDAHGYHVSKYDLVLDVSPVGAPMFRAPAEASFAILLSPSPGDTPKVRCNPAEQTVDVEVDDDVRFNPKLHDKARKARLEDERRRDLAAPAGTPSAAYSAGIAEDPELMELLKYEAEHPYPEEPNPGT